MVLGMLVFVHNKPISIRGLVFECYHNPNQALPWTQSTLGQMNTSIRIKLCITKNVVSHNGLLQ